MKIISAEFVTSAAAGGNASGIPHDGLPQIAMTGRSNVGKSTLLNALCRSKVARTSAAPGKTRLANIYRVAVEGGGPGKWSLYLVDLPGIRLRAGRGGRGGRVEGGGGGVLLGARGSGLGARTSGARRRRLRDPSARSPRPRDSGHACCSLVDSRHPGLEADIQAAHWLTAMGVDFHVVATKIDKLSRTERARNMKALELTLGKPPLPVSAADGEGLDALWKTIASLARTGRA